MNRPLKRAAKDFSILKQACDDRTCACLVSVACAEEDNLFEWVVRVRPPTESAYAGKEYDFQVSLSPENYPLAPPKVTLKTQIFNPVVSAEGKLCDGILNNDAWKPTSPIVGVMERVVTSVFVDYAKLEALNEEAARLLHTDEAAFLKKVKKGL